MWGQKTCRAAVAATRFRKVRRRRRDLTDPLGCHMNIYTNNADKRVLCLTHFSALPVAKPRAGGWLYLRAQRAACRARPREQACWQAAHPHSKLLSTASNPGLPRGRRVRARRLKRPYTACRVQYGRGSGAQCRRAVGVSEAAEAAARGAESWNAHTRGEDTTKGPSCGELLS